MKNLFLFFSITAALNVNGQTKKIDYQLHKRTIMPAGSAAWYSAVIRPIDPAKDDYKAYARYIIRDIVKKQGAHNVVINIYDNAKAYQLYETKHIKGRQVLNKTDYDFTLQHIIATYTSADPAMGLEQEISWYMDCISCPKKYRGHEPFNP